ncbi:hypothetical protein ANCCAN_28106 [Ancylostoma caninum]|uniref:Uncharacterized protein n=1 Tax=Ancylostoma caninum TaxID=29170 RepID=A0A368F5K4_ANCCA|nr:hypothetical protein ANCCAN_28106 [Ancylostoma caninum]
MEECSQSSLISVSMEFAEPQGRGQVAYEDTLELHVKIVLPDTQGLEVVYTWVYASVASAMDMQPSVTRNTVSALIVSTIPKETNVKDANLDSLETLDEELLMTASLPRRDLPATVIITLLEDATPSADACSVSTIPKEHIANDAKKVSTETPLKAPHTTALPVHAREQLTATSTRKDRWPAEIALQVFLDDYAMNVLLATRARTRSPDVHANRSVKWATTRGRTCRRRRPMKVNNAVAVGTADVAFASDRGSSSTERFSRAVAARPAAGRAAQDALGSLPCFV